MSQGSPIIGIRVPPEKYEAIVSAIARANDTVKGEPYTLTSWILHCIDAKLRHAERRKRSARKVAKTKRARKLLAKCLTPL